MYNLGEHNILKVHQCISECFSVVFNIKKFHRFLPSEKRWLSNFNWQAKPDFSKIWIFMTLLSVWVWHVLHESVLQVWQHNFHPYVTTILTDFNCYTQLNSLISTIEQVQYHIGKVSNNKPISNLWQSNTTFMATNIFDTHANFL